MDKREKLFNELRAICKSREYQFERINQELSTFIEEDEVVDYCVTLGPFTGISDTQLEVFVLGPECLYDYEMREKVSLHHVLFLSRISAITERMHGRAQDFLCIVFSSGGLGAGLFISSKLSESEDIRRFSAVVRKKIIESYQ